jgi:hypothetical protein
MRVIPSAIRTLMESEVIGSADDIVLMGGSFDEQNVRVGLLSPGSTHRAFHVAGRAEWFFKVYREVVEGVGREATVLEGLSGCPWVPEFGGAVVAVRGGRQMGMGVIQRWVRGTNLWDGFVAGGWASVECFDWSTLGKSLRELHEWMGVVAASEVASEVEVLTAELVHTIRVAARAPQLAAEERVVLLGWAEIVEGLRCRQVPSAEMGVIHGDLHLGQLLRGSGGDVQFIDFEGEPHVRDVAGALVRESRLRDVAGIVRSIGYLSDVVAGGGSVDAVVRAFLAGYFGGSMARDVGERLRMFLVQRAFREWCYEKMHRPAWAMRPLRVPIFE